MNRWKSNTDFLKEHIGRLFYKVVVKINEKYFSASFWWNRKYCIEYKLKQEAKAPIGKIFLFRDLEPARQFAKLQLKHYDTAILICSVTTAKLIKKVPYLSEDFEPFWRGEKIERKISTPLGTYVAEGVVPIAVVEEEKAYEKASY